MAAKQLNIRIGDDTARQLEYITQALQKRSPVPVNRGDALRWALREMYQEMCQREQELERPNSQDCPTDVGKQS